MTTLSISNVTKDDLYAPGDTIDMLYELIRMPSVLANMDGPLIKLFQNSMEENFPDGTSVQPGAGTIPLLYEIQQLFPASEVIVTGVQDSTSGEHGDHESQSVDALLYQINSLIRFFSAAESRV